MKEIRTGVVGVGHLGSLHSKFLAANKNSFFSGVFDLDSQKAMLLSEEIGCKAYENLDEFLKDVDAVSVATSTQSHHPIAKKCLLAGKHIFIEKPITVTLEEGQELIDIASEKGLIIQVGHIERFNPAILSLENFNLDPKFIQSDRLSLFNPRGTDVAVVLDLMIHDIDIILSLVKQEVTSIAASGVAVVSDSIDIANARLEFANGAIANVTASRISQKKMRKMRMFQKDAYISVDFGSGVSEIFRLESDPANIPPGLMALGKLGVEGRQKFLLYEQPEQKKVNALEYELDLFVETVMYDKKPVVSAEDGLRALKVADQIVKKIQEYHQNFKIQ